MGSEPTTYAIVEQVTIDSIDDTTVRFTTRSASKSGDTDECLPRTFSGPLSEVWTTPIEGAPPPVAMKPGAIGNLFLSHAGWDTTTPDGYQIYGAGTDLPQFKWPDRAAGRRFLGELVVIPSSIVVHGVLDGDTRFFDIDLLGPDAAEAQDIHWNGAHSIQLQLTRHGSQRLHGKPHARTASVWPTRITVAGAPVVDPTSSGSVDILNSELAGSVQHLRFAKRGSRVSLLLTQDGFGDFHVIPGLHEEVPERHRTSHRHSQG